MRITGTMRGLDRSRGAVRVEEVYDTHLEDLWGACTTPERLARWIATVSGEDLRVGGTVQAVFTSTWTGPVRIEVCDPPHHLLLTMEPGTDEETQLEAWLTAAGTQSRLVVEERGLPLGVCPTTEPVGRCTWRTSAASWSTGPRTRTAGPSTAPPRTGRRAGRPSHRPTSSPGCGEVTRAGP